MRKWTWAGALVSLAAAGWGGYWAIQTESPLQPASPAPAIQEFDVSADPPLVIGDLPRTMPEPSEPEVDAFEPIIVESANLERANNAEAWDFISAPIGVDVRELRQPPRPDEAPGQERTMPYAEPPYAEQGPGIGAYVIHLWQTVWRVWTGQAFAEMGLAQTPEPEVLVKPMPINPLVPLFPPAMRDYHDHGPSCPYTGRCRVPNPQ